MKRYFYTDPLAAAWMARHFGMRPKEEVGSPIVRQFPAPIELPYRAYIRPDSLHLLEPIDGDLLLVKAQHPFYVSSTNIADLLKCIERDGWIYAILQRNGTAFMWPESEDI